MTLHFKNQADIWFQKEPSRNRQQFTFSSDFKLGSRVWPNELSKGQLHNYNTFSHSVESWNPPSLVIQVTTSSLYSKGIINFTYIIPQVWSHSYCIIHSKQWSKCAFLQSISKFLSIFSASQQDKALGLGSYKVEQIYHLIPRNMIPYIVDNLTLN